MRWTRPRASGNAWPCRLVCSDGGDGPCFSLKLGTATTSSSLQASFVSSPTGKKESPEKRRRRWEDWVRGLATMSGLVSTRLTALRLAWCMILMLQNWSQRACEGAGIHVGRDESLGVPSFWRESGVLQSRHIRLPRGDCYVHGRRSEEDKKKANRRLGSVGETL